MSNNRMTMEAWASLAARLLIGAVLGAFVAFTSLHFWGTDNSGLNWGFAIATIIVFAFLSVRFGDDFWAKVKDWI